MPKLRIDEVICKDDTDSYPILVQFQNGNPTFKTQECVVQQSEDGSKVITTDLGSVIYTGKEEKEDQWKTVILARNKITGKVRLIEIGVANLKPIVDIDKLDDPSPAENSISNLELTRKFGSKKQNQQMEQREKLKVNEETVTEQMQKVTENLSKDMSSYNRTYSEEVYVPPIDWSADKAEDVYNINLILTEDQFQRIYEEIETKDYTENMQPFLKNIMVSKKSIKHIVLGVYADTLIKLYLAQSKDVVKKNCIACEYSSTLNNIALDLFTNRGKGRSYQLRDKTLCHIIVFVLLINNLKFELEDLCSSLRLPTNTAIVKLKMTGASVVTSGSKKIVQLKLPLTNRISRRKSTK